MAEVISEEAYVAQKVGPLWTASFTRGTKGMSGAALRRAKASHQKLAAEWQAARDSARAKYAELLASGGIVQPTRTQMLIERARGHPDLESTQAAQRLCRKRGIEF